MRSTGRRGAIEKAKTDLNHLGITDIYEVDLDDHILSDEDQLQWLALIHGCLQEGDRALAINELENVCTNPCELLYDETKKEAEELNQTMFKEVQNVKQEKRSLQYEIKGIEQKYEESLASHESLVNDNAILMSEMVREKEKRKQVEMNLSRSEKVAKRDMSIYKQLELELKEKLKSKELRIRTLEDKLQNTEETARRDVERLHTETDDERARSEKERHSLAAEMTKKLESKQQHVDNLTEIVEERERNETTRRQQVEELRKERERDRVQCEKDKRSGELSWKKELDYNKQLERENWKLRTKIQLESEIRSAGRKKKAETRQWSFIRWVTPRKQIQDGITSSEDYSRGEVCSSEGSNASKAEAKLSNDEFASILKQIADDLYDEAKIDSFGSQLGIIQGDIARALKTNMRYEQVTSRGTHLMLKQWRKGVSREDERIELRRALVAAKLLDLADHYFPQGREAGPEHSHRIEGSQELFGIGSISATLGSSERQTKTRETTADTDQPRAQDQSGKNHGDEASECIEQLSEEVSNHTTDGVHGSSDAMLYGGVTGPEDLHGVVEVQGSSGGQTKTQKTTSTSDQPPEEDKSFKNHREEVSEGMDQHSKGSPTNSFEDDLQETCVDVSSTKASDDGSDTLDERDVEYVTINYSDLLSNLAVTETSSDNLLILFFLKLIIDVPQKACG
eukprot:XP_011668606.1 PREDICTED: serine/threonine-protein kinase TAO1-B-like [Strongylocentrotus purpuratus]